MFSRELTVIGSRIGLRYSSAAIIPDAIYRRRHSPAVKAGFHLRDWQYKNKFFYPTASNYNSTLLRASRSVGDRYLGMVEAAGSIPALSIVFRRFSVLWYCCVLLFSALLRMAGADMRHDTVFVLWSFLSPFLSRPHPIIFPVREARAQAISADPTVHEYCLTDSWSFGLIRSEFRRIFVRFWPFAVAR